MHPTDERIKDAARVLEDQEMHVKRSASGLVVMFVFAGGCAASTAGIAQRSTAPGATVIAAAAAKSSSVVTPAKTQAEADEPNVQLRLTSRFVAAPGYQRSAIRVKPHPDNRMLRVIVDSPNYYRSSAIELEGDHAARTHFLTWNALPEGTYTVVAMVYGADGLRSQQTASFEVRGLGTSAP